MKIFSGWTPLGSRVEFKWMSEQGMSWSRQVVFFKIHTDELKRLFTEHVQCSQSFMSSLCGYVCDRKLWTIDCCYDMIATFNTDVSGQTVYFLLFQWFEFEERGDIFVKGKDNMKVFLFTKQKESALRMFWTGRIIISELSQIQRRMVLLKCSWKLSSWQTRLGSHRTVSVRDKKMPFTNYEKVASDIML